MHDDSEQNGPVAALRAIAERLESDGAAPQRIAAFRRAAAVLAELPAGELTERVRRGTLRELPGIGARTAEVITEAAGGGEPSYLTRLRGEAGTAPLGGQALHAALTGDCHAHSDWSDGGGTIAEMAAAASELGHQWLAVTDHSPRLTVARGLSPSRLREQLDHLEGLRADVAPLRIFSGIEVDILVDGSLDQEPELLDRLDVVVASVHSQMRMPSAEMTDRLCAAVADPRVSVLGHCTGRKVQGRARDGAAFDAEAVFAACREHDVAVEINSRPDRRDPPRTLLRLAEALGCSFAIDSDAHAPGQLDWKRFGCARAEECGIDAARVVNTWDTEAVLAWARR